MRSLRQRERASLLEGVAGTQHEIVAAAAADDLHAAWEAVRGNAAWHRGRGLPGEARRRAP